MQITRRDLLRTAPLLAASLVLPGQARALAATPDPLAAIEARLGAHARLGVFALDLATGHHLQHRADERFAFCSTFKFPLVAAVLAEVDAGRLTLDRRIKITLDPLKFYAPVVAAWQSDAIPVHELCKAAVTLSDNAAANLLLPLVGGPAGLTRFMAAHAGGSSRLDRIEPELNTNLPGDPRDTTTPAAMVSLMRRLLVEGALAPDSTALLTGWLVETATGAKRLRGGLPGGWRAGDKTGTGARGAVNDVAIAWPAAGRAPVLIACYVDALGATLAVAEAAHAAVARAVAVRFA